LSQTFVKIHVNFSEVRQHLTTFFESYHASDADV